MIRRTVAMDSFRTYSDTPQVFAPKVVAEIDVAVLKSNYRYLCSRAPEARRICVVKADAYGHTSAICVPALLEEGCDFFAVSCIEEALAVRTVCRNMGKKADVLILGYTDCRLAPLLFQNDIIQTAVSEEYARELAAVACGAHVCVRVHVALDTGMNRIGLCASTPSRCREAAEKIRSLSLCDGIAVEGLFTHFSRADEDFEESDGLEFTKAQFERFNSVRQRLIDGGINLFCHVCNSAATLRFPEFAFDGVRLGIALYGVAPSSFVKAEVTPVMSLKTVISHVHSVSAGDRVGYGGEYIAEKDRKTATLPIGYADGFIRAFSGFSVTVHTKNGDIKAPVIGRICMDQCMIDVSGLDVSAGDRVTVFGEDAESLSTLARMAGTIEYELLCLVSGRVPRIAKNNWEV